MLKYLSFFKQLMKLLVKGEFLFWLYLQKTEDVLEWYES